jgi:phosphatidylglycerol lysyltransferase
MGINPLMNNKISSSSRSKEFTTVLAICVLTDGLLIILTTLLDLVLGRTRFATPFSVELSILIGLTLVYLSSLLQRQKQTAWAAAIIVYVFYLGASLSNLQQRVEDTKHKPLNHYYEVDLIKNLVLPLLIVLALLYARNAYKVRSDIRSFGFALRAIFVVFLIAFFYGIIGFLLMDKSDFHHEISFFEAAHRTIDQFGFTSTSRLVPYSRRARIFLDSLNAISVGAVLYALISLFQPLRARFGDQSHNRSLMNRILSDHNSSSEDFFKIWPHDKAYFFNDEVNAGIAYKVRGGIALVVGDPTGAVSEFKPLISNFIEFCRLNDWQPSFVHTEPHFNSLYKNTGFSVQKIGEEAIVDTKHFSEEVSKSKYFRNISSKFDKQGYSFEVLKPPHHKAVINRLKDISDEWLTLPGRTERGFMMGYFTEAYMQECDVLVLRDKASTIQAFMNMIPSFNHDEANYDLIRHSKSSLGNSTDYLLMNFIKHVYEQKIERVNLGLCPLAGMDKEDENRTLVDNALQFVYSNGDRFYSFSGLHRFKVKYEPNWQSRYIAYRGGIGAFTRTLNALNGAMKVRGLHLIEKAKSINN